MDIHITSQKNASGEIEAKMEVVFDGKSFSETWKRFSDKSYRTIEDKGIIQQMEENGIAVIGMDLADLVSDIPMSDVIIIAEEELW